MPKSDPSARLVLVSLAEQADKHGRNAHPQVLTVAHHLTIDPETVTRALKRLQEDYGLISKDGCGPSGAVNWRLHVDRVRPEGSYEEFVRRHRVKKSARQASWRRRSVDDDPSSTWSDVDDDPSTVDDAESSTGRRLSVVSETTDRRLVDDGNGVHTRSYTRSYTQKKKHTAADAADSVLALLDPPTVPEPPAEPEPGEADFARFWAAYARKDAKPAARKAWVKAARVHGAALLIAEARRWADLWAAAGTERRYMPHPATWLNGERWADEPPPPRLQAAPGHHPFRNPQDHSVYDEPLG